MHTRTYHCSPDHPMTMPGMRCNNPSRPEGAIGWQREAIRQASQMREEGHMKRVFNVNVQSTSGVVLGYTVIANDAKLAMDKAIAQAKKDEDPAKGSFRVTYLTESDNDVVS